MRRTLERPEKITPDGDDGYFEQLTKAVFRAGFSWAVIREKWDGFTESFDKFELAVQCHAAERDKARKAPRSQPRRRTQSPLAAVRPSPPRPRTFRPMMTVEYEAELERLKQDFREDELRRHQLDVHQDGLRLLKQRPWLSRSDLYLYFA